MALELKSTPLDVNVLDPAKGEVEAIVSITNIPDDVGDVIIPGAYRKTLATRVPKVCWGHDWAQTVGKVLSAQELMPGDPRLPTRLLGLNAGCLKVAMQFNLNTQRGRDAFEDVKFWGDQGEWSIGYDCTSPGAGTASKNYKTGYREIQELSLFEVSPVLAGAAPMTETLAVKRAAGGFSAADMKTIYGTSPTPVLSAIQAKDKVQNGQDRSDVPAEDFAGKGDSFPITTPGSVHDAAASIGRAGDDNYPTDTLKANIIKIAKRKGQSYVDQLPDAWKANDRGLWNQVQRQVKAAADDDKGADCPTCQGKGTIKDGNMDCPKCGGSGKAADVEEKKLSVATETDTSTTQATPYDDTDPELARLRAEQAAMQAQDQAQKSLREGKALMQYKVQSSIDIEGSFEDIQDDLTPLLQQWLDSQLPPGLNADIWIEATFPDRVIAGIWSDPGNATNPMFDYDDDGQTEFWQIPYTRDMSADSYTLGTPVAVDVQAIAVVRSDGSSQPTINVLTGSKAAALAIEQKNSTRIRRRLLLLNALGEDISSTGVDPAALANTPGMGQITATSDPNYLNGQSDLTTPGMGVAPGDGSSLGAVGMSTQAGNMDGDPISIVPPGAYALDEHGNLVSIAIDPAILNTQSLFGSASTMPGAGVMAALPDVSNAENSHLSDTYHDGAGTPPNASSFSADQVPTDTGLRQMPSASVAPTAPTIVTPTVPGTVYTGKSLLEKLGQKAPPAPVPFFRSKPGAGGFGTQPWTTNPPATNMAGGAGPGAPSGIEGLAMHVLEELKVGKPISMANATQLQAAHAALTTVMSAAGIDPMDSGDLPNAIGGFDEDGVPIEVEDSPNSTASDVNENNDPAKPPNGGTKSVRVKGIPLASLLEFQALKTMPLPDAFTEPSTASE